MYVQPVTQVRISCALQVMQSGILEGLSTFINTHPSARLRILTIGILPIMMMSATLLFLPPDWPRRALLLFSPLTGVVESIGWGIAQAGRFGAVRRLVSGRSQATVGRAGGQDC